MVLRVRQVPVDVLRRLYGREKVGGRRLCKCGHEKRAHKGYYRACGAFDCWCLKFEEA